jgi:hypothetical protein
MYASPAPSYGFGINYSPPPISHATAVKGSYAYEDGTSKRGLAQGYVVPYPSVATALPSPPPSNASLPPHHATYEPAYEVQQGLSNGARRRLSNEQHSKSIAIPSRHLVEDGRHNGRVNDNEQEILVDFERRKSVVATE